MTNNFIYYKSLMNDKPVNHALINDLHKHFEKFPDPEKEYGLLTVKERKIKINLFGEIKKNKISDLKNQLQHNKFHEGLVFEIEYPKATPTLKSFPLHKISIETQDSSVIYLMVDGRIDVDNNKDVRAIQDH